MIETPSLVDQYCHGVLPDGAGPRHLRGPARPAPRVRPPPGTTFFDTQTGFAVRRWCPPLLGLEPHCPPARYLARRRELGALRGGPPAAARQRHQARTWSTPAYPATSPRPRSWRAAGGAAAHEIVRLEPLAEQVADTSGTVDAFLANSPSRCTAPPRSAVGLHLRRGRTARLGARARAARPGRGAGRGRRAGWPPAGRRRARATRCCCATCCGSRSPPACRSSCTPGSANRAGASTATDPVLLTDFLRATAGLGTDLVLLPAARTTAPPPSSPPSSRTSTPTGRRAGDRARPARCCEILELAPFGKLLFSSGAPALPELYVTGARGCSGQALDRVVGELGRRRGLVAADGRAGAGPGRGGERAPASTGWTERARARPHPPGPGPADGRWRPRPRGLAAAPRAGPLALQDSSTRRTAIHTRQEPSMCRPTRASGRWVKYWT